MIYDYGMLHHYGPYFIQVMMYDYGMQEFNPIDHVRFYQKSNPSQAIQLRRDQVCVLID